MHSTFRLHGKLHFCSLVLSILFDYCLSAARRIWKFVGIIQFLFKVKVKLLQWDFVLFFWEMKKEILQGNIINFITSFPLDWHFII